MSSDDNNSLKSPDLESALPRTSAETSPQPTAEEISKVRRVKAAETIPLVSADLHHADLPETLHGMKLAETQPTISLKTPRADSAVMLLSVSTLQKLQAVGKDGVGDQLAVSGAKAFHFLHTKQIPVVEILHSRIKPVTLYNIS